MRIANPIYDTVFKYLLDDEKVARMLLSALLGREVLSLDFRPTELRQEVRKADLRPEIGPSILVLRIDFAAAVRLEDGTSKLILIEIQKARTSLDVLRFRRYLGEQYASADNVWLDGAGQKQPLPLVTIYFLGEGLGDVDAPVVKVNRHYTDAATGERIHAHNSFIEALTHDSVVVQIDRLQHRRRTDLEQLLMVFDQDYKERSDPHLLDILEENFPERYREILRRLMRATVDKEVRDGMNVEDEVLATLQDHARCLAEKDKVIEGKDKVIEEKDKVIEDQGREVSEARKSLEEKDRMIAELLGRLDRDRA